MTQPEPVGMLVDGVDIDAVHAAVAACPGVARVGSGSLASLTTYLPGRRVPGIRINPDSVELEVTAEWGSPIASLSRDVHAAVVGLVNDRRVDITIADIVLPDEPLLPDTADSPPVVEAAPGRFALPSAPAHPPVIPPER